MPSLAFAAHCEMPCCSSMLSMSAGHHACSARKPLLAWEAVGGQCSHCGHCPSVLGSCTLARVARVACGRGGVVALVWLVVPLTLGDPTQTRGASALAPFSDPGHEALAPCAGEAVLAAQLRLVGSSRGPADDARVQELKRACQALDLEGRVEFRINIPYAELQQQLGAAVGGLHTMVDEHFGISVVEYMAAGECGAAQAAACCRASRRKWGPSCDSLRTCCTAAAQLRPSAAAHGLNCKPASALLHALLRSLRSGPLTRA